MSALGSSQGGNNFQEPPPPKGWLKQIDASSGHPFWVDTESNPPRSIWIHPFEDEQYKREHPDMVQARDFKPPSGPPPEYRRHSYESGQASARAPPGPRDSRSHPPTPSHEKRGFFGKLKDKAIGTKEEREEHKRRQDELRRQQMAQREQAMRQMMEQARQRNQYSQPGFAPGQYVQQNPQIMYGPPGGNPYAGGGYYGRRGGFGGGGMGGGGMGMGMPLLGGLAGGLLLGDMIGDAGDYGGDGGFGGDGGGDFGGGDMGGGDF